jgi:hypothetical protein
MSNVKLYNAAIRRLRDVRKIAASDRLDSYQLHQILAGTKTVSAALEHAFDCALRLERSLGSLLDDDEGAALKPFGGGTA